jgi:acyl carrier protein
MSKTMEIAAVVRQVIANKTKTEESVIGNDTKLVTLGVESLDAIEIIFELEEHFEIEIPYNANTVDEAGLVTVGDLISAVEALLPNE